MERIKRILSNGDTVEVYTRRGSAVVYTRNGAWVYEESRPNKDYPYLVFTIMAEESLKIVMERFAELHYWQIMD